MASEGQLEIFYEIVFRPHKRLQILCSTQYGKSLFVALACIVVACVQSEKVAILAPTDEKAKIIMRYFVEHLGDHSIFYSQLEKRSKLDRLRMEDTKERIIMRKGGGIFMISVQAGNSKKGIEAAMGEGAKNVIMDEACLIPDQIEATVFRMIAGKGKDAFYCKIGNPFYRNHFFKSSKDSVYHQIFIDYKQGMREGRYTEAFIDESRKKPFFDVLYECVFPGEGMVDSSGYLTLIPESKIVVRPKIAELALMPHFWVGQRLLGIDPAGNGKDTATFCVRDRFKAVIVDELATSNAKILSERALTIMGALQIAPNDVICDALGEGADIGKEIALASSGKMEIYTVLLGRRPLEEQGYNSLFFKVHSDELTNPKDKPDEFEDIFMNLRALMYFRVRSWIFAGGQVVDEDGDNSAFKQELAVIKYKHSLQGNRIQLMPKEDMRKLGIPSPNKADALALTFLRDLDDQPQSKAEIAAILAQDNEDFDPFAAV
jgi:hypothetical protein